MRYWMLRCFLVIFLVLTAVIATRPMVSYKLVDAGATAGQIGFVAACYALLSVMVAVPSGRWIDRWGPSPFVTLGALLVLAADLWLIAIDDLVSLALSQAVLGLGHILATIGLQTFIANVGPPQDRDRNFGIFSVGGSLGTIVGPLLVGLIAGRLGLSAEVVFLTVAVLMLVAAGVGVSLWLADRGPRPSATAERTSVGTALVQVMRIPSMPQAMVASMAVLAAIDVITVYLPAHGHANGIPVATVGLLLATSAAATFLSRALLVTLINLLGRRLLLVASIVIPAGALLALPAVSVVPVLFVLMFLCGLGLGVGQPLTLAWAAARAPGHMRGLVLGARLTGNRAGQLAVPALAGIVAGATGVGAVFIALAGLLGIGATLVVRSDFE